MKTIRLDEMEQYILHRGKATMEELCAAFEVSMNTVRRDIAALVERGTVEKVYGGATARVNDALPSFSAREVARQRAKQAIGAQAARLVEDGDIIFVDSGTTTMHLIPNLARCRNVTVVTNSLQCVNLALTCPDLHVLVLPGQLQRRTNSFTGMDTLLALRDYNLSKAFMAATALRLSQGVMNSSPMEYEIKRTAMRQSQTRYLLVDAAKFDTSAMLTYARLEEFSAVVTDAQPSEAYRETFLRQGISLEIAADQE